MTETTISFTDIVKLIHPDYNPGLEDLGSKMRDVKLFRDDPPTLYKLAVKWGVVTPSKGIEVDTTSIPVSASQAKLDRFRTKKLREYREFLRNQEEERLAEEARREEERKNKILKDKVKYFKFRVRNRIFQCGDIVYIRTKRANVIVTRVTKTRVYFDWDYGTSYASKKNVRFTRQT